MTLTKQLLFAIHIRVNANQPGERMLGLKASNIAMVEYGPQVMKYRPVVTISRRTALSSRELELRCLRLASIVIESPGRLFADFACFRALATDAVVKMITDPLRTGIINPVAMHSHSASQYKPHMLISAWNRKYKKSALVMFGVRKVSTAKVHRDATTSKHVLDVSFCL